MGSNLAIFISASLLISLGAKRPLLEGLHLPGNHMGCHKLHPFLRKYDRKTGRCTHTIYFEEKGTRAAVFLCSLWQTES